jgi:hypothetical protein
MDSDDPIGDALRADAEAARAEIRAEGIACPSCGVNLADLPGGHMLVIYADAVTGWAAECRDGTAARLSVTTMDDAGFSSWQNAASIAVWDDFRRREDEAFRRIIGDGPGEYTGLLSVLKQP